MTLVRYARTTLLIGMVCCAGCTQVVRGRGPDTNVDAAVDGGVEATDADLDAFDVDGGTCAVAGSPGCHWFFGRAHPLDGVELSGVDHLSPWLSTDALRLYFVTSNGDGPRTLNVAARGSVGLPFDVPDVVTLPFPDGAEPDHCTLSGDELQAVCAATLLDVSHLRHFRRERPDDPFGPGVALLGFPLAEEFEPSFRRDGLELLYVTNHDAAHPLWHYTRVAQEDPFESNESMDVDALTDVRLPSLLEDGRTLLFATPASLTLHLAVRDRPDQLSFHDPRDLVGIDSALFATYGAETRELFFNARRPWNIRSDRRNLWRVQVCLGTPCADEPRAECGGMWSEDEFHCYVATTVASDWADSNTSCALADGRLVSVNSPEELQMVAAVSGPADAWIGLRDGLVGDPPDGAFAWVLPSPVNFVNWAATEPLGTGPRGVVELGTGAHEWVARPPEEPHLGVCEIQVWPTW